MGLNTAIEQKLANHKLRKTSVRLEVLKLFMDRKGAALSSLDIEDELNSLDRITLYRTLKSFEQNGIIHQAIDRTGKTKYALCDHQCVQTKHSDNHAHFHCVSCGSTQCIEATIDSSFDVPANYKIEEVHLLVEGLCPTCNH